jgi:acyl-CoA thioesterase-1
LDAAGLDAAPDATKFADGGIAILERFSGKRILHCGDSFVGGGGGLHRGIETRFRASGAKMSSDTQVSLFMHEVGQGEYIQKLVTRSYPDVIVLTLGANDVFMPHPEYLIPHVESIAKKAAKDKRACYWVTPPVWKPDGDAAAFEASAKGVLKVIAEHAAPCKVFDVTTMRPDLVIPRRNDGIHPTDEGGEIWAAAFWEFLINEPLAVGPATAAK